MTLKIVEYRQCVKSPHKNWKLKVELRMTKWVSLEANLVGRLLEVFVDLEEGRICLSTRLEELRRPACAVDRHGEHLASDLGGQLDTHFDGDLEVSVDGVLAR